MLYENVTPQMPVANGHKLYFYVTVQPPPSGLPGTKNSHISESMTDGSFGITLHNLNQFCSALRLIGIGLSTENP